MKPGASIQINFDRQQATIEAGQSLRGHVLLEVHRYFIHGTSLKIRLSGCECTQIEHVIAGETGVGSSSRNRALGKSCFFELEEDKIIPSEEDATRDVFDSILLSTRELSQSSLSLHSHRQQRPQKIMKGEYEIPFEFTFPDHLPGTTRIDHKRRMGRETVDDFGEIKYQLEAVVEGSGTKWRGCYQSHKEILVKTKSPPPGQYHKAPVPFDSGLVSAPVKRCWMPCGELVYQVTTPNTNMIPGQEAQVTLTCQNNSSANVSSIKIKLLEHVTWKAEKQTHKFSQKLGGHKFDKEGLLSIASLNSKRRRKKLSKDESCATVSTQVLQTDGSDTDSVGKQALHRQESSNEDNDEDQRASQALNASIVVPKVKSHSSYQGDILNVRHEVLVSIGLKFCSTIVHRIPIVVLDVDWIRRSLMVRAAPTRRLSLELDKHKKKTRLLKLKEEDLKDDDDDEDQKEASQKISPCSSEESLDDISSHIKVSPPCKNEPKSEDKNSVAEEQQEDNKSVSKLSPPPLKRELPGLLERKHSHPLTSGKNVQPSSCRSLQQKINSVCGIIVFLLAHTFGVFRKPVLGVGREEMAGAPPLAEVVYPPLQVSIPHSHGAVVVAASPTTRRWHVQQQQRQQQQQQDLNNNINNNNTARTFRPQLGCLGSSLEHPVPRRHQQRRHDFANATIERPPELGCLDSGDLFVERLFSDKDWERRWIERSHDEANPRTSLEE